MIFLYEYVQFIAVYSSYFYSYILHCCNTIAHEKHELIELIKDQFAIIR
jgi:hypothetical protein